MAIRPTDGWRAGVEEEAREVAAGTLDADEAYLRRLFPESLLARTDEVLAEFEAELGALVRPADEAVLGVVERVVLALNKVNDEHGGAGYETGERESLCAYLDASLGEGGIDVAALAGRNGLTRWEITDEWREW